MDGYSAYNGQHEYDTQMAVNGHGHVTNSQYSADGREIISRTQKQSITQNVSFY